MLSRLDSEPNDSVDKSWVAIVNKLSQQLFVFDMIDKQKTYKPQ